jgi:hypothetical protein
MRLDKWQAKLAGGTKIVPRRTAKASYRPSEGEVPLDRLCREISAAHRNWEKRSSISLKIRPINSAAK